MTSISDALEIFLGSITPLSRIETVRLEDADGRVLAKKVIAPRDLPHYDRSFMDGYAVVASDTSVGAVFKAGDRRSHQPMASACTFIRAARSPKGPTRSSWSSIRN